MKMKQRLCRLLAYPLLWPVISMPGRSYRGALPALTSQQSAAKTRLETSVRALVALGERNAHNYEGLIAAETLIEEALRLAGCSVRTESFAFDGVEMKNVEGEIRGTSRPDEIVVFGAHYDTVYGSPGADDNASGVAILLELARRFGSKAQGRTIRFVAFANEENPGGAPWESMGSYAYARACRERGEKIVGMISLEMLGVYSDEPGSQHYPFPFSLLYPDVGNFAGFVANFGSRSFVRRCIKSFRAANLFPSEGVAAPEMFRDIHRSDHWSFWQFGYSALMLTDTSNFRNKLYHTERDVPEILDFARMSLVTDGVEHVANDLANGD